MSVSAENWLGTQSPTVALRPGNRVAGATTRFATRYRAYSGPKGSEDFSLLAKEQMLFKEFAVLDEALSWVRHLEQGGRTPLSIEGDDGTRMDRRAIADALRLGERERVGR